MRYRIDASLRTPGTPLREREQKQVPGVLYGPEIAPISLSVALHGFEVLLREAGGASLIDVVLPGKDQPTTALIQDVQYDPVSGQVIHVDFRQINMKKEMRAPIEFRFVGEAPAVKGLGGTLIKALGGVEIKCLPENLVNVLEVDISVLKIFGDLIRVRDLAVPPGIIIVTDGETVVAKVAAPLTEEQLKALEEGSVGPKSLEDIEVEEKGKKEEETEEGGEEAPPAAAKKEEKK